MGWAGPHLSVAEGITAHLGGPIGLRRRGRTYLHDPPPGSSLATRRWPGRSGMASRGSGADGSLLYALAAPIAPTKLTMRRIT